MISSRKLCELNKPFSGCPKPLFESEAKWEAIDIIMIFIPMQNRTHFHKKGFALNLLLKARVFGIRKWPILMILVQARETLNQKNIASTNTASALGCWQAISPFKAFGRGQTETIRGQKVFLLYFYIFLFWRDWRFLQKPIKREACIQYFRVISRLIMIVKTFQ